MAKQDKIPSKKMAKKEQDDWDELYDYVRRNVFGYDDNQSLSRDVVLRLKGMLYGKFMENRSVKDTANYSYETVLNTFKYSMPDIRRALSNVRIKDEKHKANLVMKIVEGNLNEVYIRMKNKEKTKKEAENKPIVIHKKPKYIPKAKNVDRYSDLW